MRGEVKVIPLTDFPERFSRGGVYHLSKQNLFEKVIIQNSRSTGREIIIKFEGIDTPESARRYRGALLQVPRDDLLPLPEGRYYHFQIVGLLAVTEDGAVLGKVADILQTGSNDVYLIKSDQGKELLLPALKDVVREIDLEKGLMVIRPLPGLLEV
jgi:16S rRNA processing protein RimM